jgi:hypothetical protein
MKAILAETSRVPFAQQIENVVMTTPITDIHTHLHEPAFKDLLLSGIDELLTYHYLIAESFRYLDLPYTKFWSLAKADKAELIWNTLFIKHSPVSEACRGVLTTLQAFGLEPKKRDLQALRKWFAEQNIEDHVTRCMELAGVEKLYMTNSPFDDEERTVWESDYFRRDDRFLAALRIDPLVLAWPEVNAKLVRWGYKVGANASAQKTISEVRRFLEDWTKRIDAEYVMISVPPDFKFPDKNVGSQLLEKAVIPHCSDYGIPMALMPGVKRAVNPELKLAGDGVGLSDLTALQNLCATFPKNKFMATVLARENQHELCVLARKFRNLHIFGCWWFLNDPSMIDEITRMRVELLGLSFTAQHSDARVLEQIIYKWQHSRRVIAKVLADKYSDLAQTGWQVSREEIECDVKQLFGGEFRRFCHH